MAAIGVIALCFTLNTLARGCGETFAVFYGPLLAEFGWGVPEALQDVRGTNVAGNRKYDQIAVRPDPHWFEATGRAGVVDVYRSVMRDEDEAAYVPDMGDAYEVTSKGEVRTAAQRRTYYRSYWRTFQVSDHLPLWLEGLS